MCLNEYLSLHKIISIGNDHSDIIVDNPFDFVSDIVSMHYCIIEVLWWERIEVCNARHSIGYGGPRDPRDSYYFFAETDISENFDCDCSPTLIKSYLNTVYGEYSTHELYPSFTLKRTL